MTQEERLHMHRERSCPGRPVFNTVLFLLWLGAMPTQTGRATEPVTLVREGRPEATIVVADETRPVPLWVNRQQLTVAYAAEELQRWIEKSTGASLPIVPASKAPAERAVAQGRVCGVFQGGGHTCGSG